MTLNIWNIVKVNIFILFMIKRGQRAEDGDITGGGNIVPSLQKTPLNYTLKRSRSPRAGFPIQKMETNQHEFASSSQ